MSLYCFDTQRHTLSVSWKSANRGRLAQDVVTGGSGDVANAEKLVHALNELTAAMWRCYELPASAVVGNTEEDRRHAEEDALSRVGETVRTPNRPARSGSLLVSYVAVVEHANRVGRALDAMPPLWRPTLADDLDIEGDAVIQAALGDYSGRAAQAVWHNRAEVSPGPFDVAMRAIAEAADTVTACLSLRASVGVMAATAAAATLLAAAVHVAADLWEGDPAAVFAESDNIEACSVVVPSLVVDALDSGSHPARLVSDLVRDALRVREGWIPDLNDLLESVSDAEDRGRQYEVQSPGTTDAFRHEAGRLTPLDTSRPSADRFEHLADGLRSAWTLFDELNVEASSADLPEPEEDLDSENEWSQRRYETSWAAWLEHLRFRLNN